MQQLELEFLRWLRNLVNLNNELGTSKVHLICDEANMVIRVKYDEGLIIIFPRLNGAGEVKSMIIHNDQLISMGDLDYVKFVKGVLEPSND